MIYLVTNQKELFSNELYTIIGVDKSLSLLSTLSYVGLDTETKGLDPYTKQLLLLQLGCREFQVVIDCTTVDVKLYKEFLESDRVFLGWNLKFDLKFLNHQGIYPKKVYDGFLAEKLMWLGFPDGMHSMSLKTAGKTYCNVDLDKSVRGKIIWSDTLSDDIIQYSADDVKYLEAIMNKQMEILNDRGLAKAIYVENAFVIPLAYCEYCGVKLDETKWKAKMVKDNVVEQQAIEACNQWLLQNDPSNPYIIVDSQGDLFSGYHLEPQVTINWRSAKQVIPVFKRFGIDVTVEDKKNGGEKDTIDAKQLKPQKDKCSLIPLYLNYTEAAKVTSTYGENFLKQINEVSGRIHTNFNQLGTDTGRLSSGGKDKEHNIKYVNLQNLPADEETRACFISEPGNKWISIDYSGQETYLMASIANDRAIIKELTEGSGDIHSLTAYMSYREIPRNTPIKDIKKLYHNLRQEAKSIEFAINYGGDANTISKNKNIPIAEATEIYNAYMEGFKGLQQYQTFRRKDWFDKGYILLSPVTGHKAYIYDYDELQATKAWMNSTLDWNYYREMKQIAPDCDTVQRVKRFFKRKSASEKQSINYPIQAAGALTFKYASIFFFKYLRENNLLGKVKLCIPVHDEWNIEAPADIAEVVAQNLKECMVKGGSYFCTRCKLDADISYAEDGQLPTYWIH